MKSKIFKKIALCFASALIVCSVGAVSACKPETDHPEVCITYEFNGATYEVNYKLFRNMYPHTVRHFIELSDEGFYNDTIIHDYQSGDWFTGGYSYDVGDYSAKVENDAMKEYFEVFSKETTYNELFTAGKLSASVYGKVDADGKVIADTKLSAVMGEFYNNIHQEIEKGALTAEYGCLKMYYYAKDKDTNKKVYVTPTDDQTILADYKKNCATSVFALQTAQNSSYSENDYTVFAQLKETEAFTKFVDAVKAYVSDLDKEDEFCTLVEEVRVDGNETEVTFKVPKKPIIIRSVKVTKY